MAVTTTTVGGVTSVIFTYKAATTQLVRIADQAAHFLYDTGFGDHSIPYAQYTNAQKLSILDSFVLDSLMKSRFQQDARDGTAAAQVIINSGKNEPPLT